MLKYLKPFQDTLYVFLASNIGFVMPPAAFTEILLQPLKKIK
jgi:hypothetical protein